MNYLESNDVTKEKLIELIKISGLDVLDEESEKFYVKGLDIGLWVSLDKEAELIRVFTYIQCKENAPVENLGILSNDCNNSYIFVQFSATVYEDGSGYLNGCYYIYYKFGLIPAMLNYSLRKFSTIFIEAVREKDNEDIFFS